MGRSDWVTAALLHVCGPWLWFLPLVPGAHPLGLCPTHVTCLAPCSQCARTCIRALSSLLARLMALSCSLVAASSWGQGQGWGEGKG